MSNIAAEHKEMFRFYPEKKGGHVHCRVFIGNGLGGTLVFNQEEWDIFERQIKKLPNFQVQTYRTKGGERDD